MFTYQLVCICQHLQRILLAEVNALQGMAAIGQRPLIMEVSYLFSHLISASNVLQQ